MIKVLNLILLEQLDIKNSRHFAKRQYTWLNNQIHPIYIDITKEDPLEKSKTLIDEFIKKAD